MPPVTCQQYLHQMLPFTAQQEVEPISLGLGSLAQLGKPSQISEDPASPYTLSRICFSHICPPDDGEFTELRSDARRTACICHEYIHTYILHDSGLGAAQICLGQSN
uniref:Uncharacterized protein n=1 Tax=Bionectria ochroleuca TaxID=29856 RepID=A0A8H7NE81_BIOOC